MYPFLKRKPEKRILLRRKIKETSVFFIELRNLFKNKKYFKTFKNKIKSQLELNDNKFL